MLANAFYINPEFYFTIAIIVYLMVKSWLGIKSFIRQSSEDVRDEVEREIYRELDMRQDEIYRQMDTRQDNIDRRMENFVEIERDHKNR